MKILLGNVENTVGKGENAGSSFLTMFWKASFSGSMKVGIVW